MSWIEFLLAVVLIGFAGLKLTVYGDVLADKTSLGATWVGVILLATVTSLTELVTGLMAVRVADLPEIAIGDALGACLINLLLLALLDLLHRGRTLYEESSTGHVLSASFGVLMLGFIGFSLVLSRTTKMP
jgi:cation:H+ antiporter